MPITQVRTTAASAAKSHSGPSAADLKTAAKLKTSVLDVLKLVRFGQPLAAADQPKVNAKNEWRAPNGDRLISVTLSSNPPGMADGMARMAFVNPKTNEFYEGTFGGIAGLRQFHGPLALPAGTKFTGKTFTAKDIDALTAAANHKATTTTHTVPTKTTLVNALGTYEFHKLLKYGSKGPGPSDVLKQVVLRKDNHPDGFVTSALVLKSNPNKVVFQRSGGIAGITMYSQPIDVTRLPK